jgi:hypothetical protein
MFNIPRPIGLATIRQVDSQLAWRLQNMRVIANACRQIELRLSDHLDGVRSNTEQHRRRKSSKELRLARAGSEVRLFTMSESRRFEDRIRGEYRDSLAVTIQGEIVTEPDATRLVALPPLPCAQR